MTITEVLRMVSGKTTDRSGHLASYAVRTGQNVVAYLEGRLETSARTIVDWRVKWSVHWRETDQMKTETSTDLQQLLSRFGTVDLLPVPASKPEAFFAKPS
jgi:hypothetical protein